ncbi:ABC transporter substrate-binding protein [Microbacterium sp. CIAB417]|uniref:ABC transporter substrate-binding protein n=1 Tax=Microbacterium sp. CIAB417 TaxID=2860287 RepID=UPI001FABD4EA|nr:extracellular solute-binding protein [Microbacterium sp. CIAB417]
MRRTKTTRIAAAFIAAATIASLAACGSAGGGERPEGGPLRILTGSGPDTGEFRALEQIVAMYQDEVDADFEVEYETITDTDDLWKKLRMYLVADTLPDMFSLANGPIANELISQDKVVNMTEVLTKAGVYDQMNAALKDFFVSPDGNLYMVPSYRAGEMFLYRKDLFAQHGIDVPETWEAFLDACQTLADAGVTPYVLRGADSVMLLRFLSFPAWTTSGSEFIDAVQSGDQTFSDGRLGRAGAELLHDLGTGGYFVPGFQNMTLGDAIDAFSSGEGAITYGNTNFAATFSEQYDAGTVGYFGIPVDGAEKESTGSTFPVHGGKGIALNAETYEADESFRDFFDYYLAHIDEVLYEQGLLSWFDTPIPADALPPVLVDLGTEIQSQTTGWVSWDDKLDPEVLTTMGDEASRLIADQTTPDAFLEAVDAAIADQ